MQQLNFSFFVHNSAIIHFCNNNCIVLEKKQQSKENKVSIKNYQDDQNSCYNMSINFSLSFFPGSQKVMSTVQHDHLAIRP